jgi:hypothetical protein
MEMTAENSNAHIGKNVETLFKNTICDHREAVEKIREKFKIDGRFLTAINNGVHCEKADVKMNFACGHNIDVNVKAYQGNGFNQLTRASVRKFCTNFGINSEMEHDLERIVVAKSVNTSAELFSPDDISRWHGIFESLAKSLIRWGFSNKAGRELLAIYNRETSIMAIYAMQDVIKFLHSRTNITYTKGGFNICDCVSFQRKGGNGSLSKTIDKHDIRHPGNDIQLKLKTGKFVQMTRNIVLYEYEI